MISDRLTVRVTELSYVHTTKDTLSLLVLIVTTALLVGGTVFANDVEAKTKKNFKANVQVNFESDCWTKTVIKLNDGVFGKNLAKKTFYIDPDSDEANDLWIDTALKFDGKKVKKGEIQILIDISGFDGEFIESVYDVRDFNKNQKTYYFEFNNLVECGTP